MNELITIIDEITKFGLQPMVAIKNREKDLEKNLVDLYHWYFKVKYIFDENEYKDFDKTLLLNIKENVGQNFTNFGFYKTILDIKETSNLNDVALGDANDDLMDIITDLLEVKWRIQNNSKDDGMWFFKLIFETHTKQHLLDLLNYLEQD